MRKGLSAATAGAVVLLAGCTLTPPHDLYTPPATATPTPPAANLAGELLTAPDVAAGWSSAAPVSTAGAASTCSALNGQSWQHLPEHADTGLRRSAGGISVSEALEAGPAGQIAGAYSASYAAVSQCREFTVTAPAGPVRYRLAPCSFPAYGDASYAFTVTVSSAGAVRSGDVVVVRNGATLVQVTALGSAGVPAATVEQVTSAAVAKVQ